MKKVKLFYIFVLLVLVSVIQVSAIDTEIKIKTVPFHEVQVAVAKPMSATFENWGNFKNYSRHPGPSAPPPPFLRFPEVAPRGRRGHPTGRGAH